jgi:hypothetical protein
VCCAIIYGSVLLCCAVLCSSQAPPSPSDIDLSDDSLLSSRHNHVRTLREQAVTDAMHQQHQQHHHHRRSGDIVPTNQSGGAGAGAGAGAGVSSAHIVDGNESHLDSDASTASFYHYRPPSNWDQQAAPNDIRPQPSNIAGGIAAHSAGDLVPATTRTPASRHAIPRNSQEYTRPPSSSSSENSSSGHHTMTYNTRPMDLRVQTAMSRGPKSPVTTSTTPAAAATGVTPGRRAPPSEPSPSPVPRKYQLLQSRCAPNMTVDSLSGDDDRAFSDANTSGDHDHYQWVQAMQREEANRVSELQSSERHHMHTTPGKGTVYDDQVSVHSTPPTADQQRFRDSNSAAGGGKTAKQLSNLRGMKLMQGATSALRWISSLNIPHFEVPIMSPLDGIQPNGSFQLPLFANGVLFCQLFASLARLKQPIQGVCQNPRNRAQRVQNVRKFLDLLTKTNKSDFPVHIKSYEEDILLGKGDVIVDLLLKMKDCFKYTKTRSPSGGSGMGGDGGSGGVVAAANSSVRRVVNNPSRQRQPRHSY